MDTKLLLKKVSELLKLNRRSITTISPIVETNQVVDPDLVRVFSYYTTTNAYRIALVNCLEPQSLFGFAEWVWFEQIFNIKVSVDYQFSEPIFTLTFPNHETRFEWLMHWS